MPAFLFAENEQASVSWVFQQVISYPPAEVAVCFETLAEHTD